MCQGRLLMGKQLGQEQKVIQVEIKVQALVTEVMSDHTHDLAEAPVGSRQTKWENFKDVINTGLSIGNLGIEKKWGPCQLDGTRWPGPENA
eukprot:1152677-Pelagomonas_calceolata.AAC.3